MRQAGWRVLARTSGSRPVVIFPDGHEEDIARAGLPSIAEGKKFLALARKVKAEAIVVELMAIQPECLETEAKRIFCPSLLGLTNFRLDHREELGWTREEVARNLLRSVSPGVTVFCLEEEVSPEVEALIREKGAKLIRVGGEENLFQPSAIMASLGDDFTENIRLALAVSRFLGIEDKVAIAGMKQATPDFGGLRIWEIPSPPGRCPGYLVSAFAANEPDSSFRVLERIKKLLPWPGPKVYGLLLFREDRPDRTRQWIEAVEAGFFRDFAAVFLAGGPSLSPPLRKLEKRTASPPVRILNTRQARDLGRHLQNSCPEPWVLIGLGNIGGLGSQLVTSWESVGKRIHG